MKLLQRHECDTMSQIKAERRPREDGRVPLPRYLALPRNRQIGLFVLSSLALPPSPPSLLFLLCPVQLVGIFRERRVSRRARDSKGQTCVRRGGGRGNTAAKVGPRDSQKIDERLGPEEINALPAARTARGNVIAVYCAFERNYNSCRSLSLFLLNDGNSCQPLYRCFYSDNKRSRHRSCHILRYDIFHRNK